MHLFMSFKLFSFHCGFSEALKVDKCTCINTENTFSVWLEWLSDHESSFQFRSEKFTLIKTAFLKHTLTSDSKSKENPVACTCPPVRLLLTGCLC